VAKLQSWDCINDFSEIEPQISLICNILSSRMQSG
jgi:hypothetical protein